MTYWQCKAENVFPDGDFQGPVQPPHVRHQWWQSTNHWLSMVIDPGCHVFAAGDSPPEASADGIYMLFGIADDLLYVGKSNDINARVFAHYRSRKSRGGIPFANFAFLPLPAYAVADIEVAHIYALEPPHNKLFERIRWEQHEAMIKHIQTVWGPKK